MASKSITHIKDLIPDPKNARIHSERNIGMIVSSLNQVGAARSIVISEDGTILAGNGTVEAAATAGITRIRVVEADGDTLVAVMRTGLTDAQKTSLALFDNRTTELSGWDHEVLKGFADEGLNLNQWFYKDELPSGLIEKDPTERGGPKGDPDPTDKNLSIELTFDVDEFEAFKEMTDLLGKRYKTTNVQDTITSALRELTNNYAEKNQ